MSDEYKINEHNRKLSSAESISGTAFKPHLLVYAHYYIPDTASTGQIIKDLVEGMVDIFRITVICVVPSYTGKIEDQWKTKKYYKETINGVNILRVSVPEFTKSNKISRFKNILAYFFRARYATRMIEDVDYIMSVSQPPILGGMLGVYGKKKCKNVGGGNPKFIYQIQDFNPEQVLAVKYSDNKFITDMMMKLDKRSCKNSDLVITVGRDLIETLDKRFEKDCVRKPKAMLINNWIDEKEIYPLFENHPRVKAFKEKYGLNGKFTIMYSGNIGLYYDLENLMKVIEKFKDVRIAPCERYPEGSRVVFAFVGAGAVLDKLILYKNARHLDNVTFIPYQDKENLIYSLNAGDVHWCVNAKGIKGVSCPSKYYGIMAVGKPVLGVLEKGTEVRCLIEKTSGGLVCEPGDYKSIEKNIRWFIEHAGSDELEKMGMRERTYLMKELTKDKSIEKYKRAIWET